MSNTSLYRQQINSVVATNNAKQISAAKLRSVLTKGADAIDEIFETLSLADGLGTFDASTGVATITETGVTYTPTTVANQANGKYFDVVVQGTVSVTGAPKLMEPGGVLISRGTKWDYIPKSTLAMQEVNALKSQIVNPYGDRLLVGQALPLLTTGSNISANNSLAFGEIPYDSKLFEVTFYAGTAGDVNLLILSKSGNQFALISRITLADAIVGVNVYSGFGDPNVVAGNWIGLEFPVTTGAATKYNTVSGSTIYFLNGSAPTPTPVTWNTGANLQYSANFKIGAEKLDIPRTALSLPVQGELDGLRTDVDEKTTLADVINEIEEPLPAPDVHGQNPILTSGGSGASKFCNTIGKVISICDLVEFSVYCSLPGKIKMLILTNIGTSFTIVDSIALPDAVAGVNVYNENHFGSIRLQPNQWVGLQSPNSGGLGYRFFTNVGVGNYYFNANSADPATTATWTSGPNFEWSCNFSTRPVSLKVPREKLEGNLLLELNGLREDVDKRAPLSGLFRPSLIDDIAFDSSAPSGWTLSSGWTNSSGLLSPVGSGGWTQKANQTAISGSKNEASTRRFYFTPQTSGVKFAVGTWRQQPGGGLLRSTLVQVDSSAGFLRIYAAGSSWATEPSVVSSVSLPTLTIGRDYYVEIVRNKRSNTVRVLDRLTGVILANLVHSTTEINDVTGSVMGSAIIFNISGQTLFKRITLTYAVKNPRAYFMGDSITEGLTVEADEVWNELAAADLNHSVSINGCSSALSDEIPFHIDELPKIKPEWVISYYNHNDGDVVNSTITGRYDALMAACQANGIGLAVCILAPRIEFGYPAINAYLLSLPGWVRKIRMDRALTVNHDGVNYNSALFNDTHHPNAAGNIAEYNQLKLDLPELFG